MTMLSCSRCAAVLPVDAFYVARGNKNRHQRHSWCKTCVTSNVRQRRRDRDAEERAIAAERNRGYSRKKRLGRYGLTTDAYNSLLANQGGVCAICNRPEVVVQPHRVTGAESLAVDHDHVTGEVRGLLCMKCNTAIGKLGDDPALLRRAAEYLECKKASDNLAFGRADSKAKP